MSKKFMFLAIFSVVVLVGLVSSALLFGCGSSGGNTPTTGYTLSGKVGTVSASGLSAQALATNTVTHIVAIAADSSQTIVTPESSGTFSLSVTAGQPYVLGFFNKTGTTITLLGYLQNSDYDWDSLPLIDPTGSSTDLGTIEIVTASVTVTVNLILWKAKAIFSKALLT